MSNTELSDIDIEILFYGKWRLNTSWEKVTITFKDDMTYEQSKVKTFFFHKPLELLTGNKFTGVWYVNDRRLYLNLKAIPDSFFNLQIPLVFKISIGDVVASLGSVFITEKYEVVEIDSSKFTLKNQEESVFGTKIRGFYAPNMPNYSIPK
ncbi:MAG: hypothetical protein RMX96_12175 [Nostoc sp. ChiSLP02]|nr:hypothetical protein [Nostoc sp. DedSLP05]MDZ8103423.1 hypothetical protein [Nostoc sp. DedSLP01]MDZ8185598.1 hypothetical protein [Nostoc sp. ChiSLP02]